MTDTTAPGPPNPVAKIFRDNGIVGITVIDDELGPPLLSKLEEDDILAFLDDLNDPEAKEELKKQGIEITKRSDFSDPMFYQLWVNREKFKFIGDLLEEHFQLGTKAEESIEFASIKNVASKIDCAVKTYGVYPNFEEIRERNDKLIFIDYYLGPSAPSGYDGSSPHPSVEHAKKVITKIFEGSEEREYRPVVILMSSLIEETDEILITSFAEEIGLLGGMFHFISKRDIENEDKLILMLAIVASTIKTGYQIYDFISTVQETMTNVKEFVKKIKMLKIGDYAFIQQLSLQDDGQPLGDYLHHFFSSYLGSIIFNREPVLSWKKKIDQLRFDTIPLYQAEPSLILADIYKASLFDPIGDVLGHPRRPEGSESKPFLHLGDLFVKDESTYVYMVINAQCDLSYTPDSTKREYDPERSIIFILGKLEPIYELLSREKREKPRTELFEHNGKKYRIMWDTKKVITCKNDDVEAFITNNKLTPIYRLRLPYALEVQRAFASDLTRVGMPVAPPLFQPVKLQLCCKDADSKYVTLHYPEKGGASLFLTRDGEQCILTIDFICHIKSSIPRIIELLHKRSEKLEGHIKEAEGAEQKTKLDERAKKVEANIDKLKNFVADYDNFLNMRKPFIVSVADAEKRLIPDMMIFRRNYEIRGKYTFDEPILLNIIDA